VVCHSRLTDAAGTDVSVDTHWRSAMMANAARDPFYLAKVTSEIERNPDLRAALEDKCSLCHMPMAYTQAKVDGVAPTMFESGFLNKDNGLNKAALDGVSCTLCHQVEDKALGTPESFSGKFLVDTSTNPPDRASYGPFPEPLVDNMRRSSGYTPQFGEQTLNSALCAACHTLYTPYLDASGSVAGEFPEQTAYLEWKHSALSSEGKSCQSCHMPEAAGAVLISASPAPPKISPREPFAQHYFVGGNAFMVGLFSANAEALELTCSQDHLDGTLQRVLTQLQANSVALSMVTTQSSGALEIGLRVENKAGHKFPTGFPSRRAWIHLTVKDGAGKVIFESGKPQADGSIVGCAADAAATEFESHFDIITTADQVQIYESVMHNSDGEVTYTLLRGAKYVKDNRILPRGFDKATAAKDFAVQGSAVEDANFVGGSDQVTYKVNTSGSSGPFEVSAELLYQSISYRFLADMLRDDTAFIQSFSGMYDMADKTPVAMAAVKQTVK